MVLAWAIFYMIQSFTTNLPWENCDNPWSNSTTCYVPPKHNFTGSCAPKINYTEVMVGRRSPVEDFWENRVLGKYLKCY